MPKFKTCKNCGSAEDVGILVRNCPGCGAKYEPDECTCGLHLGETLKPYVVPTMEEILREKK